MIENKPLLFTLIGTGLLVVLGVFAYSTLRTEQPAPGTYDTFATCIQQSGATFYGAFWCPHCQEQKHMFGDASRLLPYVECSTPDRQQTTACTDARITSYPTWNFANGERMTGAVSMAMLAEKTGCALPPSAEQKGTGEETPPTPEQ